MRQVLHLFLLALAEDKGEAGRLFKEMGGSRATLEQAIKAVRGSEPVNSAEAEGQREAKGGRVHGWTLHPDAPPDSLAEDARSHDQLINSKADGHEGAGIGELDDDPIDRRAGL